VEPPELVGDAVAVGTPPRPFPAQLGDEVSLDIQVEFRQRKDAAPESASAPAGKAPVVAHAQAAPPSKK
jgi:hypothetical protein